MPTTPAPSPIAPARSSPSRAWFFWPGWMMAALILVGCWLPSNRLPASETVPHVPHADKLVHFAMFASFGLVAAWGGRRRATLMLGVILAIVSELGQSTAWVGRDASVADAAADLIGLLSGIALAWLATRRFRA